MLLEVNRALHVVVAIHDSRTSQRMIDHKVREKRAAGNRPRAQPILLNYEEEKLIIHKVVEIVIEDGLKLKAFNVCQDHMHLVLICTKEDLAKIMQKIKSITSRLVNMHRGSTKKLAYLPLEAEINRGKKQNSLWTQKYGHTEITSRGQLNNVSKYIWNNRVKHGLQELEVMKDERVLKSLYQ